MLMGCVGERWSAETDYEDDTEKSVSLEPPEDEHPGILDSACGRICDADSDCASDEKCTPTACRPGANSWELQRCVPKLGQLRRGDRCTRPGWSGRDACDAGLVCWGLEGVDAARCVPQCELDADENGNCSELQDACVRFANDAVRLCLPSCDPFHPYEVCDPDAEQCSFVEDAGFVCLPALSTPIDVAGQTCECLNCCSAPMSCVGPEGLMVPEMILCEGTRCCARPCDVTADEACGPEGWGCVPADKKTQPDAELGFCLPLRSEFRSHVR